MNSVKVTVYGRIKPGSKNPLVQEYTLRSGNDEDFITFTSTKTATGKKSYRFSKIFREDATQEQVFEVVAKPVIENLLSGYNGTIFTYGQTGSGKTYTMTGDIENWVYPGLIPRTIQEIFVSKGKDTVVSITYCEIYNEHVYDLIRADRIESDLPQVSILEDSAGITHFRNLSVHTVNTAYEALQLIVRGDANKMVAETTSNAKSSRSHVIFSIALDIPHPTQEKLSLKPILYLVDLAGSEKLSKCKTSMSNPWETRYINLSLHYLEQVLVALRQPGRAHIPYRNSLMTALLRNSLGGNCITAMIATFSLAVDDIEETLQTCRFAERIALIKNEVKLNEIANPQKEIELLKKENERLKAQLKLLTTEQLTGMLTEEDKDKCSMAVRKFLDENDSSDLPFTDIRRIEYCFTILKNEVKNNKNHFEISNNKQDSEFDLIKMCGSAENASMEFDTAKLVGFKTEKTMDKNWRRKRMPVELPKVNITYKRWKSTEHLPEDQKNKKANDLPEKASKPIVISDELKELHIPSVTSFAHVSESDSFVIAGCFVKEKIPGMFGERSSSETSHFTDDIENDIFVKIGKSPKDPKLDQNPIFRVNTQNQRLSNERLSFGKLRRMVAPEVKIQTDDNVIEMNQEIQITEPLPLDQVSIISGESSHFSPGRLPLTGDVEVDEEIIKFYKARYDLFKSKSKEKLED